MIEVNTQTLVFLQSLAIGFALGMFYDVFRILRVAAPHGSAAVFAEDFLFFLVCAVLTFLFALSAVNGHLRIFLVLGELLGAVIYFFSLGVLVMRVSKTVIGWLKALLRFLYRLLLRPFVRLFAWILHKARKMQASVARRAKKIEANAKYSLKQRSVLVYNLCDKTRRGRARASGRKKGGGDRGKGRSQGRKKQKVAVF